MIEGQTIETLLTKSDVELAIEGLMASRASTQTSHGGD